MAVVKRSVPNGIKYFDEGPIKGPEMKLTDMGVTSHRQLRLLVSWMLDGLNYLTSGGVKLSFFIAEGNAEHRASTKEDKTINIDDSTTGLALAEYSSLLITDALAGILGEGT